MSANKQHSVFLLAVAVLLAASAGAAWAQDTVRGGAPALFGVDEILVNPPLFINPDESLRCGLRRDRLFSVLRDTFLGTDLPTIFAGEQAPVQAGVARITLQPTIVTRGEQTLNCISYVVFYAEARHALRLPPVDERRTFTVNYWRNGLMMSGQQDNHDELVENAIVKLAENFTKDYLIAQPGGRTIGADRKMRDIRRQENIIKQLEKQGQGVIPAPSPADGLPQ